MSANTSAMAMYCGAWAAAGSMNWGSRAEQNRRSEEHTSELQSPCNLVCRLLLEKKKKIIMKSLMISFLKFKSHYNHFFVNYILLILSHLSSLGCSLPLIISSVVMMSISNPSLTV